MRFTPPIQNLTIDQEVQKKVSNEAICAATSHLHLSSPVNKPDEMIHRDPREALDISTGTTIVIPMASQIRCVQWCPRISRINR